MKFLTFFVFLTACAYGQAASIGSKAVIVKEVAYTTADQQIHRVGMISVPGGMLWYEAQLACIEKGFKNILSIKTLATQQAVEYAMDSFGLVPTNMPWSGLHRSKTSESWTWGDGTVLGSFTNWYTTPPGSNVVGGVRLVTNNDNSWGKWYIPNGLSEKSVYALCED